MDQPDPLIKIAVRGAGLVSVSAIVAMLAGRPLADGSWLLSMAGLVLWASSEWDWWRRGKK
jgi:hypothetical protein